MIASPLIVMLARSASSRAAVISRPALLVPSPQTSMTRRGVSNSFSASICTRMVDARTDRGAAVERARCLLQAVDERAGAGLVADSP